MEFDVNSGEDWGELVNKRSLQLTRERFPIVQFQKGLLSALPLVVIRCMSVPSGLIT
jgi:hypothetical protein